MADYATTWTARLVVTYSYPGGTRQHTWRAPRGEFSPVLTMVGAARAFYASLGDLVPDEWNAHSAVFYPEDSEFSTPVAWGTPVTGGGGALGGSPPIEYGESYFQYVATGPNGSKTSRYVYGGLIYPSTSGYRILASANALVAASIDALRFVSEGSPYWATGSGQIATWKPYVNLKTSDHAVHQARG